MHERDRRTVHLERLHGGLGQIPSLRRGDVNAFSPEFESWRDRVQGSLRHLFGEEADYYTRFDRLQFWLPRVGVGEAAVWTPQDQTAYERDLAMAEHVLRDALEELEAVKERQVLSQPARGESAPNPERVFVVHGRNVAARNAMFQFLRAIGLRPLEWTQAVRLTGDAAPYVGEILERAFQQAQGVVVLLTGDDEARLREEFQLSGDPEHERRPWPQARPNVLFEAGMAFGTHSQRTVLVQLGELRPFSDIAGRHLIRLDNSTERRQELALRLQDAGCPVDLTGTEWHTAGDFGGALPRPSSEATGEAAVREATTGDVSTEELTILMYLGHQDPRAYIPLGELTGLVSESDQRVLHRLERLQRGGLVELSVKENEETIARITEAGRDLVFSDE